MTETRIINPEIIHTDQARVIRSSWVAIGSEKIRIANSESPLSDPDEITGALRLDGILPYASSALDALGIDRAAFDSASARRKMDAISYLGARKLATGPIESRTGAALLLATSHESQLELRGLYETARVNPGLNSDLDTINQVFGGPVVRLVQQGRMDRLSALCVARICSERSLNATTSLSLVRAVVRKDLTDIDPAIVEQVTQLIDLTRSLVMGIPRVGITIDNIAFDGLSSLAQSLLKKVNTTTQEDQLKEAVLDIISGRIPDKVNRLEEILALVQRNPDIKGVSFDLYDTLVQWTANPQERTQQFAVRMQHSLTKLGISLTVEQALALSNDHIWSKRYENYWKQGKETTIEQMMQELVEIIPNISSLSGADRTNLAQSLIKEWYRVELETAVIMPGARKLLSELKKKWVKIGLASNASWSTQHVRRVLKRFGLDNLFDSISISSENLEADSVLPPRRVIKNETDSEFYHYAWAKMGLTPSEILHVGDNQWWDYAAARNAGAQSVLFDNPTGYNRLEKDEKFASNPDLYRQTAYAMEKQALDLDFRDWLKSQFNRKSIPQGEQNHVERLSQEIYIRTREIFAPVYTAYAEHLLQKLQSGEIDQLLCLARDGLSVAVTVKLIRQMEPELFDRVRADQIKYIHTSRNMLKNLIPSNPNLRETYIKYLRGRGVLTPGSKIGLADLLCASGETHDLLSQLLRDESVGSVVGLYLDNHQQGRKPTTDGFMQQALGTNSPLLTTGSKDGFLLLFESLMNGPKRSTSGFREVVKQGKTMVLPEAANKEPGSEVLTKGLSKESVLFMNHVAIKGLIDAVRIHHRGKILNMQERPPQETVQRFINYLASAPVDDVRLSLPWEDYGNWFLPENNPLEKLN